MIEITKEYYNLHDDINNLFKKFNIKYEKSTNLYMIGGNSYINNFRYVTANDEEYNYYSDSSEDSDYQSDSCKIGGGKYKWTTFEHNGVLFPPDYVYKKIPVIYNGKEIILTEKQEELAFLYAKYIETDYTKNSTFNKNFWNDWKIILGKKTNIKLDMTEKTMK